MTILEMVGLAVGFTVLAYLDAKWLAWLFRDKF
jgi:hypothetical protein